MGEKKRIRFIHTADLHLGSALKSVGQTSGRIGEILKKATFTAMERICDLALEEAVDFMVIAGDLYDREARSVKAGFFLQEQFRRLAEKNIPVLIIAGNHDPLGEGGNLVTFPENVWVFGGDETQCFTIYDQSGARGGEVIARVFGRSYKTRYEKEKVFESFRPQDREAWNIGLLHTALEPESNYLPSTAGELAKVEGIDYWALGHAHTGQIISREPYIVYPGIPQGRAPDEQGIGGCFLVDLLPQAEAKIEFVPVSPVVWRVEEVWLDSSPGLSPENLDDLLELFERQGETIMSGRDRKRPPEQSQEHVRPEALFGQNRKVVEGLTGDGQGVKGYIVRWVLKGRGEIHRYLSAQGEEVEEEILSALRRRFGPEHGVEEPFLWSESIRFSTGLPLPDLAELRKSDETFNELDLVIKGLRTEAGYKAAARRLGAVWEEAREGEGLEEQNAEKIQFRKTGGVNSLDFLIEEAKELVIEKIMERRTGR